jgi:serine/threonine protein kinase
VRSRRSAGFPSPLPARSLPAHGIPARPRQHEWPHINFSKPVSDVWSFAASLYQLLTGKFPYRFDPKRDPINIILNKNPVPIRDRMPGLERNLAAVIDKALVRNPKDRFPDGGKLLASLLKLKP